jgi:hypothetical protein
VASSATRRLRPGSSPRCSPRCARAAQGTPANWPVLRALAAGNCSPGQLTSRGQGRTSPGARRTPQPGRRGATNAVIGCFCCAPTEAPDSGSGSRLYLTAGPLAERGADVCWPTLGCTAGPDRLPTAPWLRLDYSLGDELVAGARPAGGLGERPAQVEAEEAAWRGERAGHPPCRLPAAGAGAHTATLCPGCTSAECSTVPAPVRSENVHPERACAVSQGGIASPTVLQRCRLPWPARSGGEAAEARGTGR